MIRWCEITDRDDDFARKRFQLLTTEIQKAGVENEVTFTIANEETLPDILEKARSTFAQIRVGGRLGSVIMPLMNRIPSSLASLKACDSIVSERGDWWPRSFLVEGLNQTLASDAGTLDLGGSVLILGTTPQARASVAALSRVGFNKMIISDPSEAVGAAFVEDLKRSFFGIHFQSVPRSSVTQLPGICSIAVNTLTAAEDANSINELAYFNFLKTGGFWLDLSIFPLNVGLQNEALSVGAIIISGSRVFSATDSLWAESVFKVKIDRESYASSLLAP
jgi:shikimate 5-dehydrogenase